MNTRIQAGDRVVYDGLEFTVHGLRRDYRTGARRRLLVDLGEGVYVDAKDPLLIYGRIHVTAHVDMVDRERLHRLADRRAEAVSDTFRAVMRAGLDRLERERIPA